VKSIKNGQSLVEVVVALAVAGLVILAIIAGVTVAIRNATFAKNQTLATKFAQEGMEWLRSQQDKDWAAFAVRAGQTFCLNNLTWSTGSCPFALGGIFKRQAVLSGSEPRLEVRVTVSWQDTAGTHQSELTSYFSKWQ